MADPGASLRLSGAPEPDDGRKPTSPLRLTGRTWRYVVRKTAHEFVEDGCTDAAASLTFYAVLSLFPALIGAVSIIGLFGDGEAAVNAILEVIRQLAPRSVVDTLRGPVESIAASPSANLGLVIGVGASVWFASRYVGAFGRMMNRIYDVDEGRPFWKLKPLNLLITLIGMLLVLAIIVLLVVSGPIAEAIGNALGITEAVLLTWQIGKWPVLGLAVAGILAILYYGTPNVRQPKFRWIGVGALLAIALLALITTGFTAYIRSGFAGYDRFYGPLAGVVVFLLWLWIANLALLLGAEFDAEMERGRQLQGGIGAEKQIQLPPRSVRQSDKALNRSLDDVELGRALRRARGRPEKE